MEFRSYFPDQMELNSVTGQISYLQRFSEISTLIELKDVRKGEVTFLILYNIWDGSLERKFKFTGFSTSDPKTLPALLALLLWLVLSDISG